MTKQTFVVLLLVALSHKTGAYGQDKARLQFPVSLQECFNAVGRENFKVIGFSQDTGTLFYEINKEQVVILRKASGHEIQTRPEAACKPIDKGDFARLAEQLMNGATEKMALKNDTKLKSCVEAIRALGQAPSADHLAAILSGQKRGSPPAIVPPSTNR
jgi:hypothetical protein